jgi:hypothetical protein
VPERLVTAEDLGGAAVQEGAVGESQLVQHADPDQPVTEGEPGLSLGLGQHDEPVPCELLGRSHGLVGARHGGGVAQRGVLTEDGECREQLPCVRGAGIDLATDEGGVRARDGEWVGVVEEAGRDALEQGVEVQRVAGRVRTQPLRRPAVQDDVVLVAGESGDRVGVEAVEVDPAAGLLDPPDDALGQPSDTVRS